MKRAKGDTSCPPHARMMRKPFISYKSENLAEFDQRGKKSALVLFWDLKEGLA
ncbi:MAG: hypothetical protein HYR56_28210 [Acidobacteria bacterium]|nr:hypothetical protein [Acidobacteriota bacterium]MBI3427156.1 hypothetical protein [Acidobacteriota bacterium]